MSKGNMKTVISQEKIYGKEPNYAGLTPSPKQLGDAYTWYSTFYDWSDVKDFTVQYLTVKKVKKSIIDAINKANSWDLTRSTGWNCRLLLKGAILPEDVMAKIWKNVGEVAKKSEANVKVEKVVTIKKDKIHKFFEILDGKLDDFIISGEPFNILEWLKEQNVTPAQSEMIAAKYKPIYKEIYDALSGKDADLKFAYSHIKPAKLKATLEFLKGFVGANAIVNILPKAPRKPRKKKIKPASVVVSKLNYKKNDPQYKINSVAPTAVVGANQLWTFNTKTRFLSVFNAVEGKKLSVKGSTVLDFDEKNSFMKKLRKPEKTLPEVLGAGKVALRKIIPSINGMPYTPKGRINKDTLLIRTLA